MNFVIPRWFLMICRNTNNTVLLSQGVISFNHLINNLGKHDKFSLTERSFVLRSCKIRISHFACYKEDSESETRLSVFVAM